MPSEDSKTVQYQPTAFTMALRTRINRAPTLEDIRNDSLKIRKGRSQTGTTDGDRSERRKIKQKNGRSTKMEDRNDGCIASGDSGVELSSPDNVADADDRNTSPVKEGDRADEQEYPEAGLTKNLLSRFKSLEVSAKIEKEKEYCPSGLGSKPVVTPMKPAVCAPVVSYKDISDDEDNEFGAPGGIYESQPVIREDVIRECDRNDDEELPPTGLTRNILSAFRQIERSGENTPLQLSRVASSAGSLSDFGSENIPQQRKDIVREADRDDESELPSQGTTRNLTVMFAKKSSEGYQLPIKHYVTTSASRSPQSASKDGSRTSSFSDYQPACAVTTGYTEPARTDVVKETDTNEEEELPAQGTTKGLLTMFMEKTEEDKKMKEKLYKPSGVAKKHWRPKNYSSTPITITSQVSAAKIEKDDQKTQPDQEVVKEEGGVIIEEELPKAGLTKGLLHKFKSMESKANTTKIQQAWVAPGLDQLSRAKSKSPETKYKSAVIDETNTPANNINSMPKRAELEKSDVDPYNSSHDRCTVYEEPKSKSRDEISSESCDTESLDHGELLCSEEDYILEITYEQVTEESSASDKNDMQTIHISKQEEPIHPTADFAPSKSIMLNEAMSKFRKMETEIRREVQHRPSPVANKATPTPMGRKR